MDRITYTLAKAVINSGTMTVATKYFGEPALKLPYCYVQIVHFLSRLSRMAANIIHINSPYSPITDSTRCLTRSDG
jgi:hypothetical protein